MSELPVVKCVSEETMPDGSCKITLEIEDGKAEEFFSIFGLQAGDEEGLQRLMIKALEDHLVRNGHTINR